jgi:hypothetical protein
MMLPVVAELAQSAVPLAMVADSGAGWPESVRWPYSAWASLQMKLCTAKTKSAGHTLVVVRRRHGAAADAWHTLQALGAHPLPDEQV